VLEFPRTGGHAGFLAGPFPGRHDWLPRRPARILKRLNIPAEIFSQPTNIRGIVGPHPDAGESCAEIGARSARSGASAARRRSRSGATPAVGTPSSGRAHRGPGQAPAPDPSTSAWRRTAVPLRRPPPGLRQLRRHHRQPYPPDYNGLKMVIAGGTLWGEDRAGAAPQDRNGKLSKGNGKRRHRQRARCLRRTHRGHVRLARPFRIAVDCGNRRRRHASPPRLYRRLGCEVEELYCEVDGRFPEPPSRSFAAGESAD